MRALFDACRRSGARDQLRDSFEGFLDEHGVEGADREAMLAVGSRRLLYYRTMVHNRHRIQLRARLPRTAARLGEDRLREVVAGFLSERGSRSPYLRDLPIEIVEWAAPRWLEDPEVPDFIADLARHELLEGDVGTTEQGGEGETGNAVDLEKRIRFDGSARLVRHKYAVHQLPKDPEDRSEPERKDTTLLVYRDAEHHVRYMELSPLGAAVVEALMQRRLTLGQAVAFSAGAIGQPVGDDVLKRVALFLADLGERGVALGAEP